MKTPKSKTISFRVPIDAADALTDRCEKTKQSIGEYARAIVLDTLFEHDKAVLADALGDMNDTLAELRIGLETQRIELRRIAFALLTSEGALKKEDALSVIAQIFKTDV